jgi:beta-lactamase class A
MPSGDSVWPAFLSCRWQPSFGIRSIAVRFRAVRVFRFANPTCVAGRVRPRRTRPSRRSYSSVLLRTVGGPRVVTAWLRKNNFDIRLDSTEADFARSPAVAPSAGDLRDTVTPAAMAAFLDMLVHGNLVGSEATASILAEMESSPTGKARVRAGLPAGWTAGDKTGTNQIATNDVGFVMPAGKRSPIVFAAFVEAPIARTTASESALASVGRALAENFSP